jgi:uridine kinase
MTDDDGLTVPASDVGVSPSALAAQLLSVLRVRWESHAWQRRIVGIAGESGSGKSVTADELAHACNTVGVRATVLNQDNYFVLPPRTNHEHRIESLDHVGPQEVHMALIAAHMAAFRASEPAVVAPLVDYPGNRFVTQTLDFSQTDLLIVEGTYVLQLPGLDARIFLDATHEDTEARRRARNRDIDAPIVAQVLAIEHDIIARQAAHADILIDANFRIVRG